jgi:hypothetical protein
MDAWALASKKTDLSVPGDFGSATWRSLRSSRQEESIFRILYAICRRKTKSQACTDGITIISVDVDEQ